MIAVHILIADDMPMQVRMLESHLRAVRPSDVIWTACNGTEALQIVQENQIDLFLSDIYYDYAVNIPNTNGVIANMDRDAIVEVPAVMNKHGVLGIATGDLSPIAATLCNRQKTIVDYAVKGMVEGDYQASLTALALDPMIDDLDIARKLLDEGLRINADYLPQFHR